MKDSHVKNDKVYELQELYNSMGQVVKDEEHMRSLRTTRQEIELDKVIWSYVKR